MWLRILAHFFIMKYVLCNPAEEDHICIEEERIIVNVTKYVMKNHTIREYVWCVSVPPRCSKYTIKPVNVSENVEEEKVVLRKKCCPGYKLDGEKCLSDCNNYCLNGTCDSYGKCVCDEGFSGRNCSLSCSTVNGENCNGTTSCDCEQGHCHSTNHCDCFSGWQGIRCHLPCDSGRYGKNCSQICDCLDCDHITGLCKNASVSVQQTSHLYEEITTTIPYKDDEAFQALTFSSVEQSEYDQRPQNLTLLVKPYAYNRTGINLHTSRPALLKYHTFYVPSQEEIEAISDRSSRTYESTPTESSANWNEFANGNPTTQLTTRNDATSASATSTSSHITKEINPTSVPILHVTSRDNDTIEQSGTHFGKNARGVLIDVTKVPTKAKVLDAEANFTLPSIEGNVKTDHPSLGEGYQIFSLEISFAITLSGVVIIMASSAFCICLFRRNKINSSGPKADGQQTVSVYTHSIIKATLPDDPETNISMCESSLNTEGNKEIRTYLICNMSMPHIHTINRSNRDVNYDLYDHPPSTGSYRAASLPEPPSFEMKQLTMDALQEPIYDEIPCCNRPVPVSPPPSYTSNGTSSLYMNFSEAKT